MDRFDHGGNIYRVAEKYGIRENEILDFSASINPLGLPETVSKRLPELLNLVVHYPDPEQRRLRKALSELHNISSESIICANGSTQLIYLLVRALRPERVLIPVPTFSEYERALWVQKISHKNIYIKYLYLKRENNFILEPEEFIKAMEGCEMAFLCNPNNPTGILLSEDEVREIGKAARLIGCYLIVDEAFIDFCPHASIINRVGENPYLIILRSMTKFYALPGLRLGYGIFPLKLVKDIKTFQEPWSVNTLAQEAAIMAIRDETYRKKTWIFIKREKEFLEEGLTRLGIWFTPSRANYYLLRLEKPDLVEKLARKGILVRDCSNFRGLDRTYIRIAVRKREENIKLLEALAELLKCGTELL